MFPHNHGVHEWPWSSLKVIPCSEQSAAAHLSAINPSPHHRKSRRPPQPTGTHTHTTSHRDWQPTRERHITDSFMHHCAKAKRCDRDTAHVSFSLTDVMGHIYMSMYVLWNALFFWWCKPVKYRISMQRSVVWAAASKSPQRHTYLMPPLQPQSQNGVV